MEKKEIRVLFVDDEPEVLKSLRRLFAGSEYAITVAGSGIEGLEILERETVQIVVSDYRMPVMNGVEFLSQVKDRWPFTVRLILSGYADTSALVAAINQGNIYKFIPKPWDKSELFTSIKNAEEKYNLTIENIRLTGELMQKNEELQMINNNLERLVSEKTEDLLKLKEKLAASERHAFISKLTADLALEVRNPLAVIIQGADVLDAAMPAPDPLNKYAGIIRESALHADSVVRNLFSSFTHSHETIEEDGEILPLLEDALSWSGEKLQEKGISVRKCFPRCCMKNRPACSDLSKVFELVVSELAGTMPADSTMMITGEEEETAAGEKLLNIIFSDWGTGLPKYRMMNDSDMFFTENQDMPKSGQGLYAARDILKKCGGSLFILESEGRGATVFVVLPASARE